MAVSGLRKSWKKIFISIDCFIYICFYRARTKINDYQQNFKLFSTYEIFIKQ